MKLGIKHFFIGAGGLAACLAMGSLFNNKVSQQILNSDLFMEAMELLTTNDGAKYLLGNPITPSKAKFAGPGLLIKDESLAQVNVSGPKSTGILYISAKPDKDEQLRLHTVQLQVGKDVSKRLVIKKAVDVLPSAA